MTTRQPRLHDLSYLKWLRKQACACGCGKPAPSDAAHIRSGNITLGKPLTGMQTKPSDFWAVPLNHACHMRQHQQGELTWWEAHGKNPFTLAISYYAEFQAETPTTARAKAPRTIRPRKPRDQRAKIRSRNDLAGRHLK